MAHLLRTISGSTPERIPRRSRLLALGLLSGLLIAGCSAGSGAVRAPAPPNSVDQTQEVPAPPRLSDEELAKLPESTTFATISNAVTDPSPQSTTDGTVLRVNAKTPVYNQPDGAPVAALPDTELGSPTWVPVVEQQPGWSRVLLPSRPDSSTGWIYTGRSAQISEARAGTLVDVDIARRHLVLREGTQQIGSWSVGVGKPTAPTPQGRTYIMASIRETVTHFSPIILPLGAHSNTFDSYGGGPGTVALHGWPDKSKIGTASSDGCIRVPDDALRVLTTLPLGTLVLVHS